MKVRLAKIKDKKAVLKVLDQLGEEIKKLNPSYSFESAQKVGGKIFEDIVRRKDCLIFVAEDNTSIVGVATLYILPNIRHGWYRGHVEDFIVSKKERGKGVGTALFHEVKKYCKNNGIKVIKLDSGLELKNAHKFYEKNGGRFTEKMFRFDL